MHGFAGAVVRRGCGGDPVPDEGFDVVADVAGMYEDGGGGEREKEDVLDGH